MRPFRSRGLAWLALVAMLMLAIVPSLGRLAGAAPGRVEAAAATTHAMPAIAHAGHGMHVGAHASHRSDRTHGGKGPAPRGHDGHDCAYCPLLSGLGTAAFVPWRPRAGLRRDAWTARAAASRPVEAPVPALGGQGPPAPAMV